MKGTWWGSEWFAGMVIVALFTLTLRLDPLAGVEGWVYDLATGLTASATSDEGVVVVSLDDERRGSEPWQQARVSDLLDRLAQVSPRAVVLFWPAQTTSYPQEISLLGREASQLLSKQPQHEVMPLLQKIALYAEGDQRVSKAMRGVDPLILAAMPSASWSPLWQASLRELIAPLPPLLADVARHAPLFTTAVHAVALDTAMSHDAGAVRRVPLLYRETDGTIVPSLPLQLWLLRQKLEPGSVSLSDGAGLTLGGRTIATDGAGYLHPRWSRGVVRTVTLSALLDDDPRGIDVLRDRIVLVGPTTTALTSMATLPDGRVVAPVELAALTLSALSAQDAIVIPAYARWAQLVAMLLVALVLTQLLPRLSFSVAAVAGIVLLIVLFNTQLLLFLLRGEWLPLATPLLALAAGVTLLLLRRKWSHNLHQLREQLGRITVALAQQLRNHGQFDEALHHLQQCPVGVACDELYQLGLDYERKRQFNKAEQVFTYLQQEKPRFKDVAERARINRDARERIVIAGHPSSNMVSTMVMDQSVLQKPVVGRYQIERELGRGAMGMVYLGHDPKISRTVAIKTVSLAHEHDNKQLEQVRERFFREAESAGRLSHPNIVTIYDVGEEGDLAYIAMDYLPGVSLDHHTTSDTLLPVEEVLAIILQVADALDYAHDKGVIHRDIKPANIIYDRERCEATVTDFGVAHLADASKTRTGTILGSPYYMAPEQLAGAKVDGRADLFSLGVTFYQLLTGAMPFEADSITTLMYKIANSRHVSVSKLRRGVPICASRIVNQLLQKDAEKRYQSGHDLHKALQRCLK